MVTLRAMTEADLPRVRRWLAEPHLARWWLADSTADAELAPYPARIRGAEPTHLLVVELDDRPIGWCQWYRWADYPDDAAAMGALPGEVGIDYGIGEPDCVGRGIGTRLIAALVDHVRAAHPGCGILTDPEAANRTSRRVLEKNGFALVSERPVASEPSERPMAIYRRVATDGSAAVRQASPADVPALAALRAEWTVEDGHADDDPTYPARFADWYAGEAGRRVTWVVQRGDAVVGMLNMAVFSRMPRPGRRPIDWGYIANVYVRATERGSGAGTLLLDECVRYARAWRYARLVLSPSERAKPLYARAGFAPATELLLLTLPD